MTAVAFRHPRLVELHRYLDDTRADLVRAAHEFPVERWHRAATDDGWTAAQILDHLRVVEHSIVRLMQKVIGEARANGHPRESATSSVVDQAMLARMADRTRRIEAPPRVRPTGAPPRDEALAALAAERAALLGAIAPGDGLALGTLEWVHPALGSLDLYRWILSVGAHEARHTAQLRELAGAVASR